MNNILEQSFTVNDLLPYVTSSYGFWTAYILLLVVFKKKISNCSLQGDKGWDLDKAPLGKGFLWCYLINLIFVTFLLNVCLSDEEHRDTLIFSCLGSIAILIFSPPTVFFTGFVSVIAIICVGWKFFNVSDNIVKVMEWIT